VVDGFFPAWFAWASGSAIQSVGFSTPPTGPAEERLP
jgi:hypothetical protein